VDGKESAVGEVNADCNETTADGKETATDGKETDDSRITVADGKAAADGNDITDDEETVDTASNENRNGSETGTGLPSTGTETTSRGVDIEVLDTIAFPAGSI
jgi:hypothetical protein